MSPGQLERELERVLSKPAAIPDDGFTDEVLRRLPMRKPSRSPRELLLIGMTALGCLLGVIILPGGVFLRDLLVGIPSAGWLAKLPLQWLLMCYVIAWVAVSAALDETRIERN
jgi:hypothetical protein